MSLNELEAIVFNWTNRPMAVKKIMEAVKKLLEEYVPKKDLPTKAIIDFLSSREWTCGGCPITKECEKTEGYNCLITKKLEKLKGVKG